MKDTWSLQEEVAHMGARWVWFVLAILLGGTIGWGSAWVFPAPTEARAPLYVAFNSDALFTSPDDYKNAQFEEVTDLLLSDPMLDELLAGLDDARDRETLRAQLTVEWRNAGRWTLVTRDQDPARAAQVAAHWRALAFAHLSDALSHAQTFSLLDLEANLLARQLADVTRAQTRLDAIIIAVRAWDAADPVSAEARAALWAYALEFSTPRGFPEDGAPRTAYTDWITELLGVLAAKQEMLNSENQALQTRMDALRVAWDTELRASRGLSAYLVVELGGEVETRPMRSPGLLALVGGGVGLMGVFVSWLVRMGKQR